jgi:hypothetical protein
LGFCSAERNQTPEKTGVWDKGIDMPRPQRTDLHPTIYLEDISEQQKLARQAVGQDYRVKVFKAGQHKPYIRRYAEFDEWLKFLRNEGEKIDHEVLDCMLGHLEFADARKQTDCADEILIPYTLFMPGCRVKLKQEDIAREIGCSVEKVRIAIKQMKKCLIIVNCGKGWYDLNPDFFWKGEEVVRVACKKNIRITK